VTKTSCSMPRGFALLAVLWIIIVLGVLAIMVSRVTYRALTGAREERDRVVGRWNAEGCIARLRAVSDAVLREDPYRARDRWQQLDSIVGIDSVAAFTGCDLTVRTTGRPVLTRASASELDSLPGMTPEAVAKLLQLRATRPLTDLLPLAASLSPGARALFDASYADLSRRLVTEPDAWVVRSQAHLGVPPTPVNIEARFVRAGTRAALVGWKEW
jgi:type II secretory pathway pseudopilin PulG